MYESKINDKKKLKILRNMKNGKQGINEHGHKTCFHLAIVMYRRFPAKSSLNETLGDRSTLPCPVCI